MQIRRTLFLLAGSLVMVSCDGDETEGCLGPEESTVVLSIHPLFEEGQLLYDPDLTGDWTEQGERPQYRLKRAGEKGYQMLQIETDGSIRWAYVVRLLEVGGIPFLDVSSPASNPYSITGHTFWRVEKNGDDLRFFSMNVDWLTARVTQDHALTYEQPACGSQKGEIAITASTRELQAFVLRYALSPEAFQEPMELHRVRDLKIPADDRR